MTKRQQGEHGAIVPPLHLGIAHELPSIDEGAEIFEDPSRGYAYGRMGNPTVRNFEKYMCELEGGSYAWATNSGLSALHLLVMGVLAKTPEQYRHIVTSPYIYGGSYHQLQMLATDFNFKITFVKDPNDSFELASAISSGAAFVFLETPTNPTLDVFDISVIAKVAHAHNTPLVVDNTLGVTLQIPLELEADAVLHSVTKHIIGTSSGLGGAIVGTEDFAQKYGDKMTEYFIYLGLIMHPMSAWLALQNRASLPLQIKQLSKNAERVVWALALWGRDQDIFLKVNYPRLPVHPGKRSNLGRKQMTAGGGLLSFEFESFEMARTFVEMQKSAILAPHLGDANNYLIIHPASTTHGKLSEEELAEVKITPGLVRLSVGLGDPTEVIRDFEQVLSKIYA